MEAVCHNPSLEEVVARLGLGEVARKALWVVDFGIGGLRINSSNYRS